MKILVKLPDDYDFVREELEGLIERALSEVEAGARPEWAAGFLACAKAITEQIEGRYEGKVHQLREARNA